MRENKLRWPFCTRTWFQTSRRHLHVARLPPGMTGIEALSNALQERGDFRFAQEVEDHWCEGSAGEFYMRCYAAEEGFGATVSSPMDYKEFRAHRGGPYHIAWLNDFWATPAERLAAVPLGEEGK